MLIMVVAQKTNKKIYRLGQMQLGTPWTLYKYTHMVLSAVDDKLLLINKIRNDFIINPTYV